jgi:predicted RNase H-like nuclease
MRVAGLDGCAGGWVMVVAALDGGGRYTVDGVERIPDLGALAGRLEAGELASVGIDIPIGLPPTGRRRCDVEARRMIGPRRSSVFPAPVRGVLGATTHADATRRSRAVSGTGLSRQAFGLLPKVREADGFVTPRLQRHVFEVHPEVSFTALAGRPMAHYKKTPAGRAERLDTLGRVFGDGVVDGRWRLDGTSPDDVLDALAVAWSAGRRLTRTHVQLGGELDDRGLRMEIIA